NEFFLQTETLLPVQFHGARGRAAIEPERRLMLAVLVDAVRCFQSSSEPRLPAKRQEYAEAQSWIFSDDDSGFFSFGAVCDALDIHSKAVRKGLLRWEQTKHATGSNNNWIRSARPAVGHEVCYSTDSSRRPWLWRC